MKPKSKLTVEHLLERGFQELDPWLVTDGKLHAPRALPTKGGVYAFALGEEVQYVGLASKSLKQRLNFYCNPGVTQRTNLRLNGQIKELCQVGQRVRVLIAHPEDGTWNGLRLRGAEGLEAALIEDFHLSWNVRGSGSTKPGKPKLTSDNSTGEKIRPRGTLSNTIIEFVRTNPHCTELQIAQAIYGPDAVQPQVNALCRKLVAEDKLQRLSTRPITYLISSD